MLPDSFWSRSCRHGATLNLRGVSSIDSSQPRPTQWATDESRKPSQRCKKRMKKALLPDESKAIACHTASTCLSSAPPAATHQTAPAIIESAAAAHAGWRAIITTRATAIVAGRRSIVILCVRGARRGQIRFAGHERIGPGRIQGLQLVQKRRSLRGWRQKRGCSPNARKAEERFKEETTVHLGSLPVMAHFGPPAG